jgi:hypothetical protein
LPLDGPTTPQDRSPEVWALPRSLATTCGISDLISFPQGTEMFQFPWLATPGLCVQPAASSSSTRRVSPFGHPRIDASSSSPWLIAAKHVLHRLLTPRHPPSALSSLTTNRSAVSGFRLRLPCGVKTKVRSSRIREHRLAVGVLSSASFSRSRFVYYSIVRN